jgi:ribosomal protein L1
MQTKKSKRPYSIVVEFPNGLTRTVKVRAVTREIAERKALKFHPNAIGVKHNA